MFTSTQRNWIRKSHKWLTLAISIQIMLWLISGLYMVLMEIDFIRGQHLVNSDKLELDISGDILSFAELSATYPSANSITLYASAIEPRYKITTDKQLQVISALTGKPVANITKAEALSLAKLLYTGSTEQIEAILLTTNPPSEISARALPLWQVNLNNALDTRLYISATTGELVSKRHAYWRIFDFMWMLHIMDYDERENIHNPLLTAISVISLLAALSGVFLLFIAFQKPASKTS